MWKNWCLVMCSNLSGILLVMVLVSKIKVWYFTGLIFAYVMGIEFLRQMNTILYVYCLSCSFLCGSQCKVAMVESVIAKALTVEDGWRWYDYGWHFAFVPTEAVVVQQVRWSFTIVQFGTDFNDFTLSWTVVVMDWIIFFLFSYEIYHYSNVFTPRYSWYMDEIS